MLLSLGCEFSVLSVLSIGKCHQLIIFIILNTIKSVLLEFFMRLGDPRSGIELIYEISVFSALHRGIYH